MCWQGDRGLAGIKGEKVINRNVLINFLLKRSACSETLPVMCFTNVLLQGSPLMMAGPQGYTGHKGAVVSRLLFMD